MVRLETSIQVLYPSNFLFIYIPVWLDQKLKGRKYNDLLQKIYIPVWLDQKLVYKCSKEERKRIYIPVWLDQKPSAGSGGSVSTPHLHSSMVRLETREYPFRLVSKSLFTFQYGQIRNAWYFLFSCSFCYIYIPVWLDQKRIMQQLFLCLFSYLHSSMVRLETFKQQKKYKKKRLFTFQYGQIRNSSVQNTSQPVLHNLHSSMVRLETVMRIWQALLYLLFTFQYGQIRNS